MKNVPIADASTGELRDFAKNILQLDSVPSDRAGIIAAMIEGGHTGESISVAGEAEPETQALSQFGSTGEVPLKIGRGFSLWTQKAEGKPKCPMVVCRVLSTDRPGGNDPAAPQIIPYPPLIIPRGKLVEIPHDHYEVLKQAGGTKFSAGATVNDDLIATDFYEYPLTDVQLPPPAEIAAWNAWCGANNELGAPKG